MCIADNCNSVVVAKGMCRKHYLRNYRHGDMYHVSDRHAYIPKGEDSPNYKHGKWQHPSYKTWKHMIDRCTNPKNPAYYRYGGAGITVCDRWLDINNFIDDMGEKPTGYSIDRIDNSKGYYLENCRWADNATQARNRGMVKLTEALAEEIRSLPRIAKNGRGEGYTRQQIANMYGVSVATIKKVLSGAYWKTKRSGEKIVKQVQNNRT